MEAVTIGQYRVTGVIGRGGMGAVYAAEHTLLGRPAAIKILLPELSKQQDIVMRFFNEARAATAIRHPGIVEIYDFGWTPEGAAYIVMEKLEGETLARRLRRGVLPWQAALTTVRQIAGALGAAHAKGIVHRDLKPENVFLAPDPEVPGGERIKLLDFGIAKLAGETSPAVHVTRTGAVMGTPTYMAPEQCRGVSIDHRADLYALGCVLFELCTGRPPFLGEGSGDVIAAHIHVPAPTLADSRIKAPAPVERLVQHLLTKAPGQRVQSAHQLILAIDAITGDRRSPSTAPPRRGQGRPAEAHTMTTLSGAAATSEQMPAATARFHRRRVIVIATAAAITVVIVALAMRPTRTPEVVSHPASAAVQEAPAATPAATAAATPPPSATPPSTAPPSPSPSPSPWPPPSPPSPSPSPKASPHVATPSPPAAPSIIAGPSRAAATPRAAAREAAPPAMIDVVVESTPAGADVLLNGSVLGKTPYRDAQLRRTGDATLVLKLSGYADRTVTVRSDQAIRQRIELVKLPARNPVPKRDQSVNPF
jgi:serine/threonine protein kinase